MKNWEKLYRKLMFPPVWLRMALVIVSAFALSAVFTKGLKDTWIAYAAYVLSFYTLVVTGIAWGTVFPGYYKAAKKKVYENKYGSLYMTDAAFKVKVSLNVTFLINFLYAAANLFSGIFYGSYWFISLAVYYICLAVMRFLLLRQAHRSEIGQNRTSELKYSRWCGCIMLVMNSALSGMVVLVLKSGQGFAYEGMLIYVVALYTFYIMVYAVINMVKYRKYRSPLILTSKAVSLSAALFSMLSLETAMLAAFGGDTPVQTRHALVSATGAGVCVIVIGMAAYMIYSATRELRIGNYQTDKQ